MGGDYSTVGSAAGVDGVPVVVVEKLCCPLDAPDPYTHFNNLSVNLRALIVRSYCDRKAGVAGSEKNFYDEFNKWDSWTDPAPPNSPWEVVARWGNHWINTMAVVAERIDKLLPQAWTHIKYIKAPYYYGSFGFKVVWVDNPKAEDFFMTCAKDPAKETIARDHPESAAEHQSEGQSYAVTLLMDIDAHCWRELGCCGKEGLHFIVNARGDKTLDDIHCDFCDVAKAREMPGGYVDWKDPNTAMHLAQVKLGLMVPRSAFYNSHKIVELTQSTIDALDDRINKPQATPDAGVVQYACEDRWKPKFTKIKAARDAFTKDYESDPARNTTLATQGSEGRRKMELIYQKALDEVYNPLDSLRLEVNVAYAPCPGVKRVPKPNWSNNLV